jgi:hypothetical protein
LTPFPVLYLLCAVVAVYGVATEGPTYERALMATNYRIQLLRWSQYRDELLPAVARYRAATDSFLLVGLLERALPRAPAQNRFERIDGLVHDESVRKALAAGGANDHKSVRAKLDELSFKGRGPDLLSRTSVLRALEVAKDPAKGAKEEVLNAFAGLLQAVCLEWDAGVDPDQWIGAYGLGNFIADADPKLAALLTREFDREELELSTGQVSVLVPADDVARLIVMLRGLDLTKPSAPKRNVEQLIALLSVAQERPDLRVVLTVE